MMCSTWKISVFGIVALMLAFSLATTDALAAPGEATISITAGNTNVRAADAEHDITFSVESTTAPTPDHDTAGSVTIQIPSVWSRPISANNTGTPDEDGEVIVSDPTGDGDTAASGRVVGRSLVASFGKDSTGTVTFTFRTKTPVRAGTYQFPLRGTNYNTHTTAGDPQETFIEVVVGPVDAGSGKVVLTPLTAEPDTDDNLAYEKQYVLTSEQVLSNLRITYTAAGTMPQGSTVVMTSASFAAFTRQDATEVSVSGHVDVVRAAQSVTATVKEGGIQAGATVVFSIPSHYKAPKILGDAPAAQAAVETGWTIAVTAGVGAYDADGDETTTDDNFTAVTAALVTDPGSFDGGTTAAQFNFVTVATPPVGKVVVYQDASGETEFKAIVGDAAIPGTTLRFTFADLAGIGDGAKFEITLPSVLTQPFVPIDPTSTANGATTIGTGEITIDGHTIKGSLPASDATATPPVISYRLDKAPVAQGTYTVSAKGSNSPRGALMSLGGHTFEITVAAGKGTLALMQGGTAFSQTTSEKEVGDLTFVYTATGHLSSGAAIVITLPTEDDSAPAGEQWSGFRPDNGDGVADRGEVVLSSGSANLAVTSATAITLTTTAALNAGDTIRVTYKNVKAAKNEAGGSYTFTATENGTAINSVSVGIGRSPDGGGTLALSTTEADAGSLIGDLTITYTAGGKMEVGAAVEVTLPENGTWPTLGYDVSQPGGVTLEDRSSTLTVTDTTMTATTQVQLTTGDVIKFIVKNVTAPSEGGTYTFTGKSKSSGAAESTLKPLAAGVTMNVTRVASGSIALNGPDGPVSSAAPGMALGNLSFVFTAGAAMESGSKVTIQILPGWTPAFLDNNDGTDSPGEASLMSSPANAADFTVGGGGGTPWMLTATTTSALAVGDTLTFTYKQVTAPSTEATYSFATTASNSSDATPLPVEPAPTVVVRAPVDAIAISAEPTSVFTGGEITVTVTLWAGAAEGKALGDMMVSLDDGDMGGMFAPVSIMIADNMHSGSATYTNATADNYTITATSGEMTDSVDVEVKSTIRELSVNGETEMLLVTQGATLMVRAIGPVGGGTVQVLDSEGNKVGLKVGLDPIGEPDADGDQMYGESVDLPDVLADGMYTVSVEIQGDVNNELQIEVVNDQTPPSVSNADASESVVVNGDTFTLSADVAMNESMVSIESVMADLGGLDTTKADGVGLDELTASPGKYFTIITIDDANEAEDAEYTITITATDAIGNMGSDTVMVTLENDPSELTSAEVTPGSAKPGETIWINATGSEGGDASATVNNAETGMMIAQVTLDEDVANAGMYSAGLMIVEDAHPAGMYDVTVTLGTKMMTLEGALTIEPPGYDFTMSIGAGTHLIHVPLAVTKVNGADMAIATVRDLYNALGDAVNIIISLGADGSWNSYLGDDAPGMAYGDMVLGDSTGLVAVMNSAVTLELTGEALGTGGVSTISLNAGNNLVGVPLDSAQITMISDVLGTLVSAIVVSNEAGNGFQTITQAGDPGDGPLMGGEGYIVVAAAAASIPVIGSPWQNMADDGMMSAPPVAFGANVKTPVLHVRGQLVDEAGMMTLDGLTVSVRNVTSGSVLGSGVATDEYSMTFVKLNSSAAKVGDILEIKADSGNPLLGIRPVQHVVTAEDVNGSISLPDLVTYEIPAQSELLANYPNPFNPETWIPFRLAEDASVSLDIYGASGALVRSIDLGFTPAAVYEGRSDAIYWDGRNNFGEQVSSGLYFYHLRAGEFSATRRMVVVK